MSSIINVGGNGNQNNNNNNNNNNSNNNNGGIMPQVASTPVIAAVDPTPSYLINMNKNAKKGKYQPIQHRDNELRELITALGTMKKPNALIIGQPGVGKTGIVEELARQLVQGSAITDALLKDKVIYEVDLTTMFAGTKFVGDTEARIAELIDFASTPSNNAILFIDEAHVLASSGDNHESQLAKAVEALKPALARGSINVIGATTTQEARAFDRDQALNRRFSRIQVSELTREQTLDIMAHVRVQAEMHFNIQIPASILETVIKLADESMVNIHRPDSAITLLDRTCSHIVTDWYDTLEERKQLAAAQGVHIPTPVMRRKHIQAAIRTQLNTKLDITQNRTEGVQERLKNNIVGQKPAIKAITKAIARSQLALTKKNKPNSYLFIGPTGTGKTEVAKQIAGGLFGSEDDMIYVNMTEFKMPESTTRIIGSPLGYVGQNSKTPLVFDTLQSRPYQVVVLDEFEKAHESVQLIFMQALDEGFIRTNQGQLIDFKHATVIATTNAGVEALNRRSIGFGGSSVLSDDEVNTDRLIDVLSQEIKPELLNRFEHLLPFVPLTKDEYKQILAIKYRSIVADIKETQPSYHIHPEVLDADVEYPFIEKLVEASYNPLRNGRPAQAAVYEHIENLILDNPGVKRFDMENESGLETVSNAFQMAAPTPEPGVHQETVEQYETEEADNDDAPESTFVTSDILHNAPVSDDEPVI